MDQHVDTVLGGGSACFVGMETAIQEFLEWFVKKCGIEVAEGLSTNLCVCVSNICTCINAKLHVFKGA